MFALPIFIMSIVYWPFTLFLLAINLFIDPALVVLFFKEAAQEIVRLFSMIFQTI